MSLAEFRFDQVPVFPGAEKAPSPCLVLFYADWCGHCQTFKPRFPRIATDIPHYRVDASQANALCREYQVRGFPTILWVDSVQPGGVRRFRGPRTTQRLERFVALLQRGPLTQTELESGMELELGLER